MRRRSSGIYIYKRKYAFMGHLIVMREVYLSRSVSVAVVPALSMSVASSSSLNDATSDSHQQVSSKTWSLTYNSESKDVLVWKHGSRLKLKDGQTAGRVHSISVVGKEGIVMVIF